MLSRFSVMLIICLSLGAYMGTFTALVYGIEKRNDESVTFQHTLHRQFDPQWSNWVYWERQKCLAKHMPHKADAVQCMIKKGLFI